MKARFFDDCLKRVLAIKANTKYHHLNVTTPRFYVDMIVSKSKRWLQLLSLWVKSYGVTIQMKATEQYFPVVLFIMLYKMVLTFESADEILWCDHSNES